MLCLGRGEDVKLAILITIFLFLEIDYLAELSYVINIKNPPRQTGEDSYSFNPNFLNLLTLIRQLLLQELLLPEQLLPLRVH